MKTFKVPHSDLTVSSVVLGLMRIAKLSDTDIRALFDAAVESGVTMIDHADVYGGAPHVCEARFGEAVKLSAADRGRIMIQSKAGIRQGYFDFSSEHIIEAVDGSLKALRTDYLDVLLLHRPDTLVEPGDVAKAFDTLHAAGKVRHFGVSNQTPGQIELLKSAVREQRPNSDSRTSFPSGHTSAAFATATVIADYNHKYAVPAYGLATVIGWSRVDVGSHYWWDVVAGAVLGYAVAKQFTKTSVAFSPQGIRCAWTW